MHTHTQTPKMSCLIYTEETRIRPIPTALYLSRPIPDPASRSGSGSGSDREETLQCETTDDDADDEISPDSDRSMAGKIGEVGLCGEVDDLTKGDGEDEEEEDDGTTDGYRMVSIFVEVSLLIVVARCRIIVAYSNFVLGADRTWIMM